MGYNISRVEEFAVVNLFTESSGWAEKKVKMSFGGTMCDRRNCNANARGRGTRKEMYTCLSKVEYLCDAGWLCVSYCFFRERWYYYDAYTQVQIVEKLVGSGGGGCKGIGLVKVSMLDEMKRRDGVLFVAIIIIEVAAIQSYYSTYLYSIISGWILL